MKRTFLNGHFAFAIVLFLGSTVTQLQGQIVYAWTFGGNLIKIDVANCTVCKVGQFNVNSSGVDLVVMPDGTVISSGALNQLRIFTPPNQDPTQTFSGPGNHYYYTMSEPLNGIVYVYTIINGAGVTGVTAFDPATGTLTYLGNFPLNWSLGGFFIENNTLYANALVPGGWSIIEVNTTTPSASIILSQNSPLTAGSLAGEICSGAYTTAADGSREILYLFDPATNDTIRLCDFRNIGFINQITGLSAAPPGLPEFPCVCATSAGILDATPLNPCIPNAVSGYATQNPTLDVGQAVRYILFTDLADTLGSIIAISTTADIPFNPATMQAGTVYYYAVMAGPLLPNGNLDINDPCFDISNAVSVIWQPRPTVVFSAANPNVCAGACTTVTATFTGTAPFTLTYTSPASGTVTQTFPGNTGTFQVCTLPGSPPGSLVVPATELTDAFCTCQ
jgi:hypothetical protein